MGGTAYLSEDEGTGSSFQIQGDVAALEVVRMVHKDVHHRYQDNAWRVRHARAETPYVAAVKITHQAA